MEQLSVECEGSISSLHCTRGFSGAADIVAASADDESGVQDDDKGDTAVGRDAVMAWRRDSTTSSDLHVHDRRVRLRFSVSLCVLARRHPRRRMVRLDRRL